VASIRLVCGHRWSADGKELYYRNGDKMMAASMVIQPTFSSGRPRVLFEGSFQLVSAINDYDLTPDGREFLMLRDDSPFRGLAEYKVVLNWLQELKKLEAARSAPPSCGSATLSSHCAHSVAGGLEQLWRTSGG